MCGGFQLDSFTAILCVGEGLSYYFIKNSEFYEFYTLVGTILYNSQAFLQSL